MNQIIQGDALEVLKTFPDNSVNCTVTSPPYFGLRDYQVDGQVGLEKTPEEFIEKLVSVFREIKRITKDDGTLWIVIGDSYAGPGRGPAGNTSINQDYHNLSNKYKPFINDQYKQKDLIGIPWMLAFALRADGWYLRQDIIWNKPNPMPESMKDRCTKSHEYIFMLSKSSKYYFDQEAIRQPLKDESIARMARGVSDNHKNINGAPGQTPHSMNRPRLNRKEFASHEAGSGSGLKGHSGYFDQDGNLLVRDTANKKSVWTVTTKPYKGAHFATFPPELIKDCIKAGCPENGIVLDPFLGSGTTAMVAKQLKRNYMGIELNSEYIELAKKRIG